MILVDIFVPSVDKTYDFQLNETISVGVVIEEIAEIISRKEQTEIVGSIGQMHLCDKQNKTLLPKSWTLAECRVTTGASLILI